VLLTKTGGSANGPPLVLLHDRDGDYVDLQPFADALGDHYHTFLVRAARTQMAEIEALGYFWFFESAPGRPDISTFGDALFQVEALALELENSSGRKLTLFGQGQGGVLALTMALIWPEIVGAVAVLDAGLPDNLSEFPIDLKKDCDVSVLLARLDQSLEPWEQHAGRTAADLRRRGARVDLVSDPPNGVEGAVCDWLAGSFG
jgi:predicted esterase